MDLIRISNDIEKFDFTNLEKQGIQKQIELIDKYLSDELINLCSKKLLRDNLKSVIKTWNDDKKLKVIDIYVERRPFKIASIIDWFDIKDDKALQDIAVKIAKNGGYIARDINKFRIQDETVRIDIAKECIKNETHDFIDNVDKFFISNQNAICELAKESMERLTTLATINFKKFKIKDEATRIEFAKAVFNEDKSLIAYHVDNFEITNKEVLQEFASTIAKKTNGGYLAQYIKKFNIQDEKERIEIAKHVVKNGHIKDITNFDITDKKALYDILTILSIRYRNPSGLTQEIEKFGLEKAEQVKNIFNIILMRGSTIKDKITILRNYKEQLSKVQNEKKYAEEAQIIEKIREFYFNKKKEIDEINFDMKDILGEKNADKIMNIVDLQREDRTKKISIEIIENVLFMASLDKELQNNKDVLTKLIVEIISVKNIVLKAELLPLVAKLLNERKLDKALEEMKLNDKKKAFPAIYAVIFNKLNIYDDEELLESMRKVFNTNSFLKDSKSVYSTLLGLIKLDNTYLQNEKVKDILRFVFKYPKQIKNNIKFISLIISFEEIERLEKITPDQDENVIKDTFYDIYKSYLNINDKEFSEQYEKFMNKEQNIERNLEEYIMVYIAKRNKDEEVMNMMRKFLLTMYDIDSFRKERYDKTASEHLNAIKDDVYNKWISDKYDETLLENNNAHISDDPVDLFLLGTEIEGSCQSVFYDGDLNACLMGYVMDGKNKVVEIKNKGGKIRARCIVRLMIEKGTNNVFMLREKMYKSVDTKDDAIEELNKRCIDYAKWLGVSLVCDDALNLNRNIKYKGTLESKKGQVPFEYVDSMRGVYVGTEGYDVENWSLIYLYKNE